MDSLKDFGECIITIQACVIKKFLQGFMAPKQKKKKKQGGEESSKAEEVDDEKKLAEEARVRKHSYDYWTVSSCKVLLSLNTSGVSSQVATAVEKWKTAIREAQTFSRMHVLLGMLDACIKWDMSAENARCKVCRRKGKDSCCLSHLVSKNGVNMMCIAGLFAASKSVICEGDFANPPAYRPSVCKSSKRSPDIISFCCFSLINKQPVLTLIGVLDH